MKLSTRIITAVLLVAGSSGAVYAFSKHGDWGMTRDEKIEFISDRVTRKLELDDSQRANFEQLAQIVADVMREVRPSREQRARELAELLQQPSFDQARALALVRERTSLIDAKAPEVIARLAVFLDSLSPEQRGQLQQFIEHRHHGHGH